VELSGFKPLQSPEEFVRYMSFTGTAFHSLLTDGQGANVTYSGSGVHEGFTWLILKDLKYS
jgi:hypothetical protein